MPPIAVSHFKVQISEHSGISHSTVKKVRIDKNKLTVIQEQLLFCKYSPYFEDFSIFKKESNDIKLIIILESILSLTSLCLTQPIHQYLQSHFDNLFWWPPYLVSHHMISILVHMQMSFVKFSILFRILIKKFWSEHFFIALDVTMKAPASKI